MKKICTVFGARPQLRAVAVSLAFQESGKVEEIIIRTGTLLKNLRVITEI